jgi:hypothetical protein
MLKLPLIQQKSLFRALIDAGAFAALHIMDFISKIWDIDSMPSTDRRFNTLREDIQQHYINNNDWDEHHLFVNVLGLHNKDDIEKFQRLIELIPSSEYQNSPEVVKSIVALINSYLLPLKQRLVSTNWQGTIYEVRDSTETDETVSKNVIPFFVKKNPRISSDRQGAHSNREKTPAFVLAADTWDDFGVKSKFYLSYHPDDSTVLHMGSVKIIVRSKNGDDNPKITTQDFLQDEFLELTSEFCSLGQVQDYYQRIKDNFPEEYRSIFWALKDCAVYPTIEERFEHDYSFCRSLLRTNQAERLLRDAKFLIEGIQVYSREQFKYHFQPPFSESKTLLDVEFDSQSRLPSRLFAVVGKNGAGKTQMMSNFTNDLAQKKQDSFEPQLPLFSKVITVSTSLYDHCSYPNRSNEFNYEYIGLTTEEGNTRTIITKDEIDDRLQKSCERINEEGRTKSLRSILSEILPEEVVKGLFPNGNELLNSEELKDVRQKLSSGESTLLYFLTCLVSTLRFDTLLLLDEPETHLHPNAITALMTALYKLLEEFESYAIVVTHSPLVIREIKSKHVRIMERFGNRAVIRKIQIETLGANISVLVDEIFGNKDITQYYRAIISKLAAEKCTEEEIYEAVSTDGMPLPIGLEVFIKYVVHRNEEGEALP